MRNKCFNSNYTTKYIIVKCILVSESTYFKEDQNKKIFKKSVKL